jgi:hypothetical protein
MREAYYFPWKEAVDKASSQLPQADKLRPFLEIYAISAFGNKFALYRQDFRSGGNRPGGITFPRPAGRASAKHVKDVAPASWWHYDAAEQTGKDRLEWIANRIMQKPLHLQLITCTCLPVFSTRVVYLTSSADSPAPSALKMPPELLFNTGPQYNTDTEAASSDPSPDSSFDDDLKDVTYAPELDDAEREDSEIDE